MARKRKAKATSPKVDHHRQLDASNKLAAAIASISNEFGFQINGSLTVVEFPKSERQRSAYPVVYSSRESDDVAGAWALGGGSAVAIRKKKLKRKTDPRAVYVVNAGYSATS